MKRKISFFLFFCLLLTSLSLPAAAYARISYGADCLAGQAELIKTALHGDNFTFSETDFKQALGVTSIKNVTILSLPDRQTGSLCHGFASYCAKWIVYMLTGYRGVEDGYAVFENRNLGVDCEIALPFGEDYLRVSVKDGALSVEGGHPYKIL